MGVRADVGRQRGHIARRRVQGRRDPERDRQLRASFPPPAVRVTARCVAPPRRRAWTAPRTPCGRPRAGSRTRARRASFEVGSGRRRWNWPVAAAAAVSSASCCGCSDRMGARVWGQAVESYLRLDASHDDRGGSGILPCSADDPKAGRSAHGMNVSSTVATSDERRKLTTMFPSGRLPTTLCARNSRGACDTAEGCIPVRAASSKTGRSPTR